MNVEGLKQQAQIMSNECRGAHACFDAADQESHTLTAVVGAVDALNAVANALHGAAAAMDSVAKNLAGANHRVNVAKTTSDVIGDSGNSLIAVAQQAVKEMHDANLEGQTQASYEVAQRVANYFTAITTAVEGLNQDRDQIAGIFGVTASMLPLARVADEKAFEGAYGW